eukprot:Skav236767  [mRNA]  locus=scaffold2707:73407:74836:+ [translate_table: standard]
MKVFAYVLVFMCLLRLIQYMEVHPRVDLIARTVKTASGDMFHFCLIFLLIYLAMAWLAHWSFGPDKIMFSSFRTSVNTCFQMLIGEYPFEDEWTESTRRFLAFQHGWPSTCAVMKHLEAHRLDRGPVSVKELLLSQQVSFSPEAALSFLKFYHWYLGSIILDAKGRAYEESRTFVLSYMSAGVEVSNADFAAFIHCVIHIQSVARRRTAYKKAAQLRKQKQKQMQRMQTAAVNLGSKSAMELKGQPDSVVREFGSWLGINSQVVEALLLMRAAGMGTETVESVGTQSTSLGEEHSVKKLTPPHLPQATLREMQRLEDFGDRKLVDV